MRTIRLPDVEAKVGLKKSTIYAFIKQGQFPHPIKLSVRTSAWLESSIDDWLRERVVASGLKAA